VNLGADNTRIYPTLVIKGTALERLMNQGKYVPLSLDEAVETSKEILKVFNNAGVKVLRIGLHQSDELSPEKSLVAGPYHRSFSELVQTELWYDLLKEQLGGYKGNVEVSVNGSQVNFVYGYEGKNRKRLAADGVFIKVKGRSDFEKYETRISAG
jgi:histone acetyltransferase (RNA polymerase elongator complex component)